MKLNNFVTRVTRARAYIYKYQIIKIFIYINRRYRRYMRYILLFSRGLSVTPKNCLGVTSTDLSVTLLDLKYFYAFCRKNS
jgi:hypothetical protein